MSGSVSKATAKHYLWGLSCDSWVLLDSEGLSVKQEMMPAGTKELLHFHENAQQFFFILNGEATFFIEEGITRVKEQNGILISPGEKHYISNESDSELEFLVISQPSTNNDRVNV